jgi:hypothetical protein
MNILAFGTGMELTLGYFNAGWVGLSLAPSSAWQWREIFDDGGRSLGWIAMPSTPRRWSSAGHKASHTSWFRTTATPVHWEVQ